MAEDVRQIVGLSVRRCRRAAGISQAELAARMGVDRAYISGLELGQRNPTVITLWHLAKALGVDFRQIFREGPIRNRVRKGKTTKRKGKNSARAWLCAPITTIIGRLGKSRLA